MPRLDDYYHDGDEVINRETTRETDRLENNLKTSTKIAEKRLEKMQERWMDVNNPALWSPSDDDE